MLTHLHLHTTRLLLQPLSLKDAEFIFELVNTEGWLQFIGNRNVTNLDESYKYIQKLMDNPNIQYWVVRLNESSIPIGIVTFIKRDYLEYHDIGFAFLPQFGKNGYAHEATLAVLQELQKENAHPQILATTIKNNVHSIQLLEKLGFQFEKIIPQGDIELLLYASSNLKKD
jgi:RimJ/RimL family protein N-acetyltransferase